MLGIHVEDIFLGYTCFYVTGIHIGVYTLHVLMLLGFMLVMHIWCLHVPGTHVGDTAWGFMLGLHIGCLHVAGIHFGDTRWVFTYYWD